MIAFLVLAGWRRRIVAVEGSERLATAPDPFILIANHSQRPEAVLMPVLAVVLRGGKRVRFLSDWMFQLMPVVGIVLRRSRVITLTHKPARPRILNLLRPLWHDPVPALVRARKALEAGDTIGVFPEGTVNRDPHKLLRGNPGAAKLSLETARPVVIVGIRFPSHAGDGPITDNLPFSLHVGEPLRPPPCSRPGHPTPSEIREWHATMMRELARLSGKTWTASTKD